MHIAATKPLFAWDELEDRQSKRVSPNCGAMNRRGN